jgi:hypothetical protein
VQANAKLGEQEGECENANEGKQWWVVGKQWWEQERQQQHWQRCTLTPTRFFVYFSLSEYAQQQQPHCIPLSPPLLSF